jgi:hypothetical protein
MFFIAKIIPQPFKESEYVPMGQKDLELLMVVWPIMAIALAIYFIKIFRE